jgi:biphenyl 2,3-dioxygenase subunit beta
MPIFEDRLRNDRRPQPELLPAVYDDDWEDLDDRIKRLETGLVWTEDPPSRIRHLVTNVEAYDAENGEIEAYSNFLVCRNRLDHEETILVGGREDRLTRRGGELRIRKRKIVVPQRVVKDTNLYYFI